MQAVVDEDEVNMQAENEVPSAEPTLRCAKCQGAMEEGYINSLGYPRKFISFMKGAYWLPKSFLNWAVPFNARSVIVFRCGDCGYLEFYTR